MHHCVNVYNILGGKVNVKDSQWLTPLHYAAARGHDVSNWDSYLSKYSLSSLTLFYIYQAAVRELIKNQADIMAREKNWMTPLHLAAHNNHIACAGKYIVFI